MMDSLRRDLRDGFRALRSAPLMSATIVCLIALVVGGNTTIYGLVHAVLTKPARGVVARQLVTVQRFIRVNQLPLCINTRISKYSATRRARLHSIAAVRLEPLTLRVGPD